MNTELLKTATWEDHKRAERTEFMRKMITGEYDERLWRDYLTNLYLLYSFLETRVPELRATNIDRAQEVLSDLGGHYGKIVPSTYELVERIKTLDDTQVLAHIYVRWLADLNGGKFIAKNCKFSHKYLIWEDVEYAIDRVKTLIHPIQDQIVEEAKLAFDYAKRLGDELLL